MLAKSTDDIQLQPGESALAAHNPSPFWSCGLYVFTLGLWELWRRKHVLLLTNQRLVSRRGILTKSETSIDLARIQEVKVDRSIFIGGYVTLSTAGGPTGLLRLGPLSRADAMGFGNSVKSALPASPAAL